MAGFFDWLLTDPTAAGGSYLGRLLGLGSPAGVAAPGSAETGAGLLPQGSLLGNSPLGSALRGGLAGMGAAQGLKGFGAQMAAGALGGEQAAEQHRRSALQDSIDAVRLSQGSAEAPHAIAGGQATRPPEAGPVAGSIATSGGAAIGRAVTLPGANGQSAVMVQGPTGALRPLDPQSELVLPGPDGTPLVFRRAGIG